MNGSKVYRFHIRVSGRRTSVTVDTMVANCIAARFGLGDDGHFAASAARLWAQDEIDIAEALGDLPASYLSRWLQLRALALVLPGEDRPALEASL